MKLRLASYNVHKCVGLDRRRKPHRIIDVINEVDADIVALQEVDLRLGSRPAALPLPLVEHETGYHVPDFAPESPSLGWHGQAILLRQGIEVTEIRRILLPGLEPRGALMAELACDGLRFRIIGAHLGLLRRYRLMQMAAIRAAVSARAVMPTAILGDFNEWSSRYGMTPLTDDFRVHAPGRSFPAARPIGRLDRIGLSEGWHLKQAGVHASTLARIASDHLPVWADVTLSLDG
ncbi:endonuclease/exonuclease/phosphatase family protein [Defluviimonas sp. WL0002]|uniref:Endonuclease/exonuclease/phosphatase family protein n=1 Tax=Albidovulum marisflavi TaxID=2984159 RepID=A0ABT2ZBS1_9RHOB|nr:endonuclease/exonuclease/phosphatase family protein [Defluviimonas sp. WL0002]MCV2868564.1 endonuclease/exonuclease/phosphatase family protein [Defluviimonas sp. WL0002]